jgi:hypothetical protein
VGCSIGTTDGLCSFMTAKQGGYVRYSAMGCGVL